MNYLDQKVRTKGTCITKAKIDLDIHPHKIPSAVPRRHSIKWMSAHPSVFMTFIKAPHTALHYVIACIDQYKHKGACHRLEKIQ